MNTNTAIEAEHLTQQRAQVNVTRLGRTCHMKIFLPEYLKLVTLQRQQEVAYMTYL